MRVLHAIDSAGLYGAEIVTLNLMEAQKKLGLNPTLLSIGDNWIGAKNIEIEAKKRGVGVEILRFKNGFNIKGSAEIINCTKKLGADIIHSHGYKTNILLGIIPRRLRRIPVITTLHGWTSKRVISKIFIYEWVDAIALKNLDKVVAVTSAIKGHPRLRFLGIQPVIIKNGLPVLEFGNDDFSKEFTEVASKIKGKFKIVSIGRLSPEKGHDILIKALARTVTTGINAFLVLFGEGGQKSFIMRLAEKEDVQNRIFFAGYQDRAYRFLPFFDVFVLPSYTEGLPITLLEAMQAEIPIVATNVGGIPEVLDEGKYGQLIRPGNPEELADILQQIYINYGDAKRKAFAARQMALTEYGMDKMAQRYFEEYQKIL